MDQFQEQLISLFQGSPLFIASQILGLCLCIISFFIYYLKKREHILITKLISDVLCVIQQAMGHNGVDQPQGLRKQSKDPRMRGALAVEGHYRKGASDCRQDADWSLPGENGGDAHGANEYEQPNDMGCPFFSAAVVKNQLTRDCNTIDHRARRSTYHYPVAVLQNTIQIVAALLGLLRDYKEYRARKTSAKESSK